MQHRVAVGLARAQDDIRPAVLHLPILTLLVDRVGERLRLKAERAVLLVDGSVLAGDAVEEVARVELDARLVRPDFHDAARLRLHQDRREPEPVLIGTLVEHEVVVVAAGIVLGGGHRREVLADRLHHGEVERRSRHRRDLARGDERRVDRRVALRGEHQQVAEDVSGAVAREVPVGVVREVHDRRLVGGRAHVDLELVGVRQRVDDRRVDIARVALLAIGRAVGEGDARAGVGHLRLALPHHLVETLRAAVEVVRAVVGRERVLLAVDREAALGDAVRAAAGGAAEVLGARHIVRGARAAEPHIVELAAGVGRLERHDDRAVVADLGLHAARVAERPEVDGLAVDGAPVLLRDLGRGRRGLGRRRGRGLLCEGAGREGERREECEGRWYLHGISWGGDCWVGTAGWDWSVGRRLSAPQRRSARAGARGSGGRLRRPRRREEARRR